jgi:SAM-dependent methyltransferase
VTKIPYVFPPVEKSRYRSLRNVGVALKAILLICQENRNQPQTCGKKRTVRYVKLGTIAQNPLEWGVLGAGLVPTPLLDTIVALLLARTVMTGTRLGVFEALASGPLLAQEVAVRCNAQPAPMEKLLGALAGTGYVVVRDARYRLAPVARKWLLKNAPSSLYDAILLQFLDAGYIEHMEEYLRTGTPVHIHEQMSPEDWGYYQRGMRSGANLAAGELVRRVRLPRARRAGATRQMLDIGGAHGYYSVAFCRKYSDLRATILDLPPAVEQSAPLLASEGMGDRIHHQAGDARTVDLGEEVYDLVLIANLVHHFSEDENRDLLLRVARALRPGGLVIIGDMIRPEPPGATGQIGALTDLYFALTSESGTWSFQEMARWQRLAGLRPRRPLHLITGPGAGLQIAVKTARP